jgi:hypothetical protein
MHPATMIPCIVWVVIARDSGMKWLDWASDSTGFIYAVRPSHTLRHPPAVRTDGTLHGCGEYNKKGGMAVVSPHLKSPPVTDSVL